MTQRAAASLAGDWKALFGAKTEAERNIAPWWAPCDAELDAMVHNMADAVYRPTPVVAHRAKYASTADLADAAEVPPVFSPLVPEVVFLVDGSGSVTNEDFNAMKGFIRRAGVIFIERHPAAKLGVVQFANDVRVERELTQCGAGKTEEAAVQEWTRAVDDMVRINGGTNMEAPLRKAQRMFSDVSDNLGAGAARVVGEAK